MRLRDGVRNAHDERGGTLVLILVVIVIIGVSCVATFGLANVNVKAQAELQAKSANEEAGKNAIEDTIALLTASGSRDGVDLDAGVANKCGDSAQTVGAVSGDTSNAYYSDTSSGKTIRVYCRPDGGSGRETAGGGGGSLLPRYVITTVGGIRDSGNIPAGGAADNVPFCDMTTSLNNDTNTACEAGIYLGSNAGSVYIGQNSTSTNTVWSNSSIVTNTFSGAGVNTLSSAGTIWARRSCQGNVSSLVALGAALVPGLHDNQCDFATMAKTAAERVLTCGGKPQSNASDADPIAVSSNNATCDYITPFLEPTGSGTTTLTPVTVPTTCSDGYVEMPVGRYNDLTALNNLMNNAACADTMFWFPGGHSYYFDFDPASGAAWTPPVSPMTAGNMQVSSNIVGGVPKDWLPCSHVNHTLSDGSTSKCEMQPERTMTFNYDTSTSAGWTNPTEGVQIDSAPTIDDPTFTPSRNASFSSNSVRRLSWKQPEPRIPERTGTVVKKIVFGIKHREFSANAASWKNDSGGRAFPTLTFSAPGAGNGSCVVSLSAVKNNPAQPNGATHSELSTSLKKTEITLYQSDAANANNPPTYHCPGDSISQWDQSMAGLNINPAIVNALQAEYSAQPVAGLGGGGDIDGVYMKVTYAGRPAPSFPGGCDSTQDGAQFIFGGASRMYFVDRSAYTELCGRFNTSDPAKGHKYSVAMVGLDGKTASSSSTPNVGTGYSANAAVTTAAPPQDVFTANESELLAAHLDTIDDGQPTIGKSWSTASTARIKLKLPNTIPANSIISNVSIRVRHAATGTTGTPTITVTPSGLTGWTGNLTTGALHTDPFTSSISQASWAPTPLGSNGRDLTDTLSTPAHLNGAIVTYEVPALAGFTTLPKTAELDGVEIKVTYREPGKFRPLSGCLTTRTKYTPYSDAMVGTDKRWAPKRDGDISDDSYIGGASYSSGATSDTASCALLKTFSDGVPGQQFRVNGMIYAPTAVIDLSSTDNEGSMFTLGLVARQLTVTRWKPELRECFGGSSCEASPTQCTNRKVTLSAFDGTHELIRTHVIINDNQQCTILTKPPAYTDWSIIGPKDGT